MAACVRVLPPIALLVAGFLSAGAPDRRGPPIEPEEYAYRLTRHTRYRYGADLREVRKRGVLRVLTRNNSVSYYIARGKQRGFEFELASAFADALGVRVAFVIPETRGELIQALFDGEGDMIAAGTTKTPARAEKVAFSEPYIFSKRVVVTRENLSKPLRTIEDLPNVTIHVSFRSTTVQDARAVEALIGRRLQLEDVTDGAEMERMMERVVSGEYEATIVDDNLLGLEQAAGLPLVGRIELGEPRPKAWAFHPGAFELRDVANQFLKKKRRLVAILRARYFKPSRIAKSARAELYRADRNRRISPYDTIFRQVGQRTGIDWRLLAAVAFAESRFNPNAESRFGAQGLMQLLPSTARRVGVSEELKNPRVNVTAGARYLARLMKVFGEEGVAPRQQIRFALASYNCGLAHVMDARELARKIGKDPNRWFNEVEYALRLKEVPKWHRKTRYGYARARETIAYVSRIQSQYDVFARHVPLTSDP